MIALMRDHRFLVALSVLWLALCVGLVRKHRELVAVFFAFIGSFCLAAILSANTWLWINKNQLTSSYRSSNTHTKNLVGLVASTVAFWYLTRPAKATGEPVSSTAAEYIALSIAAGYLAFEHWFFAMYCQCPPKPIMAVIEDALTLTVVLVLLVVLGNQLHEYRMSICAWMAYKTLRLTLQLNSRQENVVTTKKQPPLASSARPTCLSDKAMMAKALSADPSLIWTIHGEKYYLTDYVDRHPGGREAILLGRGRDCTALFESYHPFTSQHRRVLEKHRIVENKKSASNHSDPFYDILCQRVAKTLQEKGIDPVQGRAATPARAAYYCLIATALIASGIFHCRGSIVGSFLFAVFGWLIGSLGHDAGHFAASRCGWINDACVWGMSLLCNPIMWQHQHTFAHHSHTNSFEHDPDVHHFTTLLRVHRRFQQNDIYKNQTNWIYVAFAYTLVVFGTCIWVPIGMIQEGSLYGMVEWTDRRRPLRAAGMYLHLSTYVGVIMILPFWTQSWWRAMIAVTLHIATSGLIFAIFSQINHINEASMDMKPVKRSDPSLETSWAVAQIETSNNFCPKSRLWHFLSNGLNLQIEHHLFPGLNHCHLHHITEIVQSTCREYGVLYKNYNSWSELMGATLQWLNRLSVEPELIKESKSQ